RTLASLPGYFYSVSPGGLWVHLYAEGTAHVDLDGSTLKVAQRTEYPWEGHIRLLLEPETETPFTLRLRVPGWCREAELLVNGEDAEVAVEPGSYVEVERMWRSGDEVELSLAMPVERVLSNPLVLENSDRVALRRGPLVYCLEAVDNPGVDVWSIVLPAGTELEAEYSPDLLNGVVVIRGDAFVVDADFGEDLYGSSGDIPSDERRVPFKAIPYHAWANREPGPMIVWIRSRQTSLGFGRYAIG
ncbi:MAG: glycoside hydrolase family 127 protein, partial [Planctomycetota bacterium]